MDKTWKKSNKNLKIRNEIENIHNTMLSLMLTQTHIFCYVVVLVYISGISVFSRSLLTIPLDIRQYPFFRPLALSFKNLGVKILQSRSVLRPNILVGSFKLDVATVWLQNGNYTHLLVCFSLSPADAPCSNFKMMI